MLNVLIIGLIIMMKLNLSLYLYYSVYNINNRYKEFIRDLNENMVYEQISAEKICKLNNTTINHICNNYRYDFMTNDNICYEVKTDKASLKTNNYFIEFLTFNKKPSGISTSEANYYIINDMTNYYLIEINILKSLYINRRVLTLKDKSSTGFIIPCDVVRNSSVII